MRMRRRTIQAELEDVSGAVLTPIRWVVLLGIVGSLNLYFDLDLYRPGLLAAAAVYAVVIAGVPRLRGRPLSSYGVGRVLLTADLLFSAVVFQFSGGIRSPYFALWYLGLIHAALVLGWRAGMGVAAGAALLVIVSELYLPGGRQALLDLNLALGKLPFLLLIAWAAGRLGEELREREHHRRAAERRALTLQADEERVRQEMEMARRVQEYLLPASEPRLPGLDIATLFRPAREVGGDVFDLVELPEGRVMLTIADVSGKGMPAALMAVAVQQGMRQYADPDPGRTLAGVNHLVLERSPEEMFVTAACVVMDLRDGSTVAASAGHPAPLRWNDQKQRLEPLTQGGMALGLLPEWDGPADRCRLAPGDAVVLFTDGLLDAKVGLRDRFGEERLNELLRSAAPEDAREWVERLRRALNGCLECPDDVTVVAVSLPRVPTMPADARTRRAEQRFSRLPPESATGKVHQRRKD